MHEDVTALAPHRISSRGRPGILERRHPDRRLGERRRVDRRIEERRWRPIPVAVSLRNEVDRRRSADRRARSELRSPCDRRLGRTSGLIKCEQQAADGEPCTRLGLVRNSEETGWLCLEHLLSGRHDISG